MYLLTRIFTCMCVSMLNVVHLGFPLQSDMHIDRQTHIKATYINVVHVFYSEATRARAFHGHTYTQVSIQT
jgi:hypothetical protein